MALPDNMLVQSGTAIVLADSTDHAPAALNNLGARTDQFNFESVANNAARQSAKVDLGATRAEVYACMAAFEFATAPTAGNVVELWWAPSPSGTAATGNPGNISGADAAYTGYSSNVDPSKVQLQFIGNFICTAQATGTIQTAFVGFLYPAARYGSLLAVNKSGVTLHSDAVEMSVALTPLAGVVTD